MIEVVNIILHSSIAFFLLPSSFFLTIPVPFRTGHCEPLNVAITPNGKKVFIRYWNGDSFRHKILCWDLENENLPNGFKVLPSKKFPIFSSLNGNKIVYETYNKTIEVLNLKTEEIELTILSDPYSIHVSGLIMSLDERILISPNRWRQIVVWNLLVGRGNKYNLQDYSSQMYDVKAALDSRTLIISGYHNIYIWDLYIKNIEHTFEVDTGILDVKITPDGQHIISYARDNSIRIWDLHTKENIRVIENDRLNRISTLTITPDGESIVTGSNNGEVKIWEI